MKAFTLEKFIFEGPLRQIFSSVTEIFEIFSILGKEFHNPRRFSHNPIYLLFIYFIFYIGQT